MKNLSGKELAGLGRDITAPFSVSVSLKPGFSGTGAEGNSIEGQVEIKEVLRLLPGKRLVALAQWQDKPVLAKLFFQSAHWKRHLQRELNGIRLLIDNDIRTPDFLFSGTMIDNRGGILLNQFLEGSSTAVELLSTDNSQFGTQFDDLLDLIFKCYEKGLWQNDIHPGNFLVFEDKVYLLDSADVKSEVVGKPLSEETWQRNLAIFLSQFPVTHDKSLETLLSRLNERKNGSFNIDSIPFFTKMVKQARENRIDAYSKKLTRSSSAHRMIHDGHRFLVYDRKIFTDDFVRFIDNPDKFVDPANIVKAGNTSTVAIVEVEQKRLLLKRYNIKSVSHGLTRIFRKFAGHSRALNSWRFSFVLASLGVKTTTPYLAMERRWLRWFPRESYFLADIIEGRTVIDLIEDENLSIQYKKEIISTFAELFEVMQDCRISHGDLKASNFIFRDGKLYVLDLDAMVRHKKEKSFRKSFARDLERFCKNWDGKPGLEPIAEQARELTKTYMG